MNSRKSSHSSFKTVFGFGVAALALFTLTAPSPTHAQIVLEQGGSVVRTVSVTGSCTRSITPDQGLIVATATALRESTVEKAASVVNTQYETFRKELERLALNNVTLETSGYNLSPAYEWVQPEGSSNGQQVLKGYDARLGLQVKTKDIARLGEVLTLAATTGIKDVGGFQLIVSTPVYKAAYDSCLAEAVADAKKRAEQMATAAGSTLGNIVSVNENEFSGAQPYMSRSPMMAKAESMGASMDVPSIEAGETEINLSVNAVFEVQ